MQAYICVRVCSWMRVSAFLTFAALCGTTWRVVAGVSVVVTMSVEFVTMVEEMGGEGGFVLKMERSRYHSTDHLNERGVEKGSGGHSTLRGRGRSVFNQADIRTVSRATLGRQLREREREGAKHVWTFPRATVPF